LDLLLFLLLVILNQSWRFFIFLISNIAILHIHGVHIISYFLPGGQ